MNPNEGPSGEGAEQTSQGVPANTSPANPLMTPAPAASPSSDMPKLQVSAEDSTSAEEQVWVEKAKAVLHRTMGDPYTRHDVMAQLKTQYLQQRFGKNISDQGEKADK